MVGDGVAVGVAGGVGATVGNGRAVGVAVGVGAGVGDGVAVGVAGGVGAGIGDGTTVGIAVCGVAMTTGTAVAGAGEGTDVGSPFPPPHATAATRPDSSMPADSSRGARSANFQAVTAWSITVSLVSVLTGRWCRAGLTGSSHAPGPPLKQGEVHRRGFPT